MKEQVVKGVLEKTQSVRLYRSGSPDEGSVFWTPSEVYAREQHPDLAMHEAMVLSGFTMSAFRFQRTDPLVQQAIESREADVLTFLSEDGQHEEFMVLNPAAIKVEK